MIRGIWDRETVALLLLCASLPIMVTWFLAEGWGAVARLVFVTLCIGIWQLIWMLARAQPPSFAVLLTALAIVILAPENLGALQLVLGVSLGIVFGELAFGGWGRNILNPATVTLAFLGFGFPGAPWPELPIQLGWAAIPAALVAAWFGVVSARLLLGAGVVFAAAVWIDPGLLELWPTVLIVLVLLVADPVASASTPVGAWVNGALYAGFVALFHATWQGSADVQMAVSAAFLVSLAVPLIDEAIVSLWVAQRRRKLD
ncbi:RnfABCDGE type electron transport complex subunit D [Aliiroseovarius sp. S1339]|uniref:RnfABCDGE type electron transport complex subunit D n=1 Tax=Aliiroseovarius sp. S1339 TaxID=2936990 RepID=UPI0020BFFA41|nr:RnfABCDGE type electron transport complex subunit D [Aliiroseovarius sp. S1339]MCK8462483.1 RnfABCDGE type electron transport complex subunit D [Aliiroseovarius sp. S1339]